MYKNDGQEHIFATFFSSSISENFFRVSLHMNNIPTEYKTQHSLTLPSAFQVGSVRIRNEWKTDLKTEAVILEALESQDTGH